MSRHGADTGSIVFRLREKETHTSSTPSSSAPGRFWEQFNTLLGQLPSMITPVFGGSPQGEGTRAVLLPYDEERTYFLSPPPGIQASELLNVLKNAGESIEYAEHPSLFFPDPPVPFAGGVEPADWAIAHCGFDAVWETLDSVEASRPVLAIDYGRTGLDHPCLQPRIKEIDGSTTGPPSNHAAAVSSILAAVRPARASDGGVWGCCSAALAVCNVASAPSATNYGFDYCRFQRAIRRAARECFPVVNISMSGPECDETTTRNVAKALEAGVSIVASVGNEGDSRLTYPAALDGVIGVGAIGRSGGHLRASNRGKHVWVAAPGEGMRGVTDRSWVSADLAGTSFATPMVSAAAWMIHMHGFAGKDVAPIIAETATKDPSWMCTSRDDLIGFGVLNMRKIKERLGS